MKTLVLIIWFLAACTHQDPLSPVRQEIEAFKRAHPKNLRVFDFKGRRVGFAFNGDPTKPVLLLVHGSPGSWEGWGHFLGDSELLRRFFMIAIDRPGFGLSGARRPVRSLQSQAEAALAALALVNPKGPAIVVGHSFGGPVVAKMASIAPERIRGVVFAAASLSPRLEDVRWYQHLAHAWPLRSLLPDALYSCNEEIYSLRHELKILEASWANFRTAVAIVHGDADGLVPVANASYIIEHLPPGVVVHEEILTGANHYLPWEHPTELKRAIFALDEADPNKL